MGAKPFLVTVQAGGNRVGGVASSASRIRVREVAQVPTRAEGRLYGSSPVLLRPLKVGSYVRTLLRSSIPPREA